MVEPSLQRREAAAKLGASDTVGPDGVADLLGERGADLVIEASGRPAVMAGALELAGFRGRVAYIGTDVGGAALAELGLVQSKELRIIGSIGSPGVWPETLRFLVRPQWT